MQSRATRAPVTTFGLLAALCLAAGTSAAGDAPKRKKVTCEEFRADTEKSSKAVGYPMVLKANDWGKTPAPLRALPPKASLCGSADNTVFVASPLTGKDLEAYYTPILQKLDCKPVTCEFTEKKTSCSCKVDRGIVRIGTEELNEAYAISYVTFGRKS